MAVFAEIYGLYDPITDELRYIGKANDTQLRLKSHLRDSYRLERPINCWVRKLVSQGLSPVAKVLEHTDDWCEAEVRLIAAWRENGARLLNLAHGGNSPGVNRGQCSKNGKALNDRLRADPKAYRLREIKRTFSTALRDGAIMNCTRAKMRFLAEINPRDFGKWVNISDREENADGSPIGGYRRSEARDLRPHS